MKEYFPETAMFICMEILHVSSGNFMYLFFGGKISLCLKSILWRRLTFSCSLLTLLPSFTHLNESLTWYSSLVNCKNERFIYISILIYIFLKLKEETSVWWKGALTSVAGVVFPCGSTFLLESWPCLLRDHQKPVRFPDLWKGLIIFSLNFYQIDIHLVCIKCLTQHCWLL